jgi:hypothetical protein
MGVNANFIADFSTFLSAINAADVAMADFGKGADTVATKLNNMVDKWSGRGIIQQANELVVAIDKVGGATALTTTEQAKLNATLTEAIAKYTAIGEKVPPDMQKLADQTKQVSTAQSDLLGTLQSLAGAFGIAFSVDALVGFGEKLFANAQALQTLSLQTRIGVEDLQVLTAATASYGVTGDELGRALFNLQQRIAGGDQSVVHAYALMGISLDDLRNKDAKSLFLDTERGLGSLSGAIQDAAAKDLYGGKLGSSMVAFSTGVDDAMEKAGKLNKATADSVKAMAEYADSIERAKTSFMNFVTEGVGGAIGGIENLNKAMGQGGSSIKIFAAGWQDWFQTQITGVQHAEHLAAVFDALNVKTESNTKATSDNTKAHADAAPVLDKHAEAVRYMETLQSQAGAPLLEWQVKYLEQLQTMNQLDAQHATGIGVTVQQLEKYKAGLETAKKATDDLAKAQKDADAAAMDQYTKRIKSLESIAQANLKAYSFEGQIAQINQLIAAEEASARAVYDQLNSAKDRSKVIEDLLNREIALENQKAAIQQKQAGVVNAAVLAELAAQTQLAAAYGQNVDGTTKVIDANAKLAKSLDELHAKKQAGISQYAQEQVLQEQYLKDLKAETDASTGLFTSIGEWVKPVNALSDALVDAGKKIKPALDSTKQSVTDLHGSLNLLVSDPTIPAYFGSLASGLSSVARTVNAGGNYTPGEAAYIASGGIIHGSIGGITNFRAAGGPVEAGQPYVVGEKGPETFVPRSAGTVLPNSSGLSVTINVNGSVLGTPDQLARTVGAAMMSLLKSQGTRLPFGAVGSSA